MGSGIDDWKVKSALVDQLAIHGFAAAQYGWIELYHKEKYTRWAAEMRFIVDQGLAIVVPDTIELSLEEQRVLAQTNSEGISSFAKTRQEVLDASAELDRILAEPDPSDRSQQELRGSRTMHQTALINALTARSIATFYTELKGKPAASLEALPFEYELAATTRTNAVQVTLENIQLPSSQVPWEDIVQLKQDAEYRFHLGRFRAWVSEIGADTVRAMDLRDQVGSSVSEYQRYMKAAGVKVGAGAVSWTISSAGQIIRDLLDLKPLSAVGTLLSIAGGRADQRLVEGTAPGTHLSVVSFLRDRYRS